MCVHFFRALAVSVAVTTTIAAQPVALSVNTSSREEVRQFYRAIFHASENVPMEWTGSYAVGNAGDTSAAFKEATRLRINFYRALVGVPANITFNPVFSAKAQQAALMMSANNALNHFPPTNWTFYTAVGAEAAGSSNIAIGQAGPDAVSGYVADSGANNAAVGHRRWLFYPQTLQMGTGDVPGVTDDSSRPAANAIWIFDTGPGQFGTPRPATRTLAVAYPPAGYVPYTLVWPRWSFSFPGADFSSATVTMSRNGQSVAVAPEPLTTTTTGEPTIVWAYDGRDTNLETPHARPAADTIYTVNVANVRIAGALQSFSYNVIVFDPDVPGPDHSPVSISGSATPPIGSPSVYSVSKPPFTGAFDWRTVQLLPFTKTFTAETGLDGLIPSVTPGYTVVQTSIVAAGSAAFRLAHLSPRADQVLLLPETFYVAGADASVSFRSRLAIATPIETARVEISTDDGVSWVGLFAQSGTSSTTSTQPVATESAFVNRTISLSGYSGRTIRVRLVYAISLSGIAFLPDPNNNVGWFIDDVSLQQVQAVTPGTPARVSSGTTFTHTPNPNGQIGLQARGVMFTAYPLEWGPLFALNPSSNGLPSDRGRLSNLSILTGISATEDSFAMGFVVGGAGTQGSKPVLVRAVGPSLTQLNVEGVLGDPKFELISGGMRIVENDNWGGAEQLRASMEAVGAFSFLGTSSRDAATVATISSADNSVAVSSANNGVGAVIAELYDSTPNSSFTATTPRLVNVSVRKHIGDLLTVGFNVGGSTAMTVLVRAIGPTLGAEFNVDGVVSDPQLTLYAAGGAEIGANNNWGGTPVLSAAFAQVAAFALPPNSQDAALVARLEPGSYTVGITGVGNTTGVALIEVYELPTP